LPAALTLFVGVGDRGGRVVDGLGQWPPFSPADLDPDSHLGRMTLLHEGARPVASSPAVRDVGRLLAGEVVGRLQRMLAHRGVDQARAREARGQESAQATKVLVVLLADLGEEAVREAVGPTLDSLEDLAAERLRPIFASHRHGWQRNLVILPVLSTPHVPSAGGGKQIAARLRELYRQVQAKPVERRSVPQLYLLENVTDLSVLEEPDVDALLENFCLFISEGVARCGKNTADSPGALGFGAETLEHVLRGAQPEHPLGTFSVARTETGGHDLQEYLRCTLALQVLRRVRDAPVAPEGSAGAQEVRADVAAALERPAPVDIHARVREIVSQARLEPRDPPPWHRFRREVLQYYGPDEGDPTIEEDRPTGEDQGWLRGAVDRIRASWRELISRGFDELNEEFQLAVADWESDRVGGPGVRDRLRKQLDEALLPASGDRPTAASYREARQRTAYIVGELEDQLGRAVTHRDRCEIELEPSFSPLRRAHGELLRAARAVPPLWPLGLAWLLFCGALTALLGPPLRAWGLYKGFADGTVKHWLTVAHPHVSVGLLAGLALAGVGIYVFMRRYQPAREAHAALWDAADEVVLGQRRSLLSYFRGRLEYAWQLARVGVLNRTLRGLERDLARLREIDRAMEGAIDRYHERLAAIGVVRSHDGEDDPTALFSELRSPLVWPLLDPAQVAAYIKREARADADKTLSLAEEQHGIYSRWRQQLPYLDDCPLDDALQPEVERLIPDPPWERDPLAEMVDRSLLEFSEAQRRSLPIGLPFRGAAHLDRSGVAQVADGLLVPEQVHRRFMEGKEEYRQTRLATLLSGAGAERIYSARVYNGVDAATVFWWKDAPGVGKGGKRR